MGKIVLAAKIAHVPSILISERPGPLFGKRQAAIDGLKEIGKRARERGADTFLVFDTHWLSNFGCHMNANARHKGVYTSHEAPHMIQNMEYDYAGNPELADMISAYQKTGGNLVAVSPVPQDQAHLYGIVGVDNAKAKVSRITEMVEKPPRGKAPSNLHISGRYILQPEIFDLLASQERGAGGEIQLTDSMNALMHHRGQPFHAVRFEGRIFDCGSKIGFLMANVAYALARDDLGPSLKSEIKKLL